MNNNLTEIVFLLDRSGSMKNLESDTIGGYNSYLDQQRNVKGEAIVTTVLFDNKYEFLHNATDIRKVNPITEKEYYARGMTALLDAVGTTIAAIHNRQNFTAENNIPFKTLFVIITDGMENASHEYSLQQVKQMIEIHKKKYKWEFVFLGANIDAVDTAQKMGITKDRSANYKSDAKGTRNNFDVLSSTTSYLRECGNIHPEWKKKIDDDFNSRK